MCKAVVIIIIISTFVLPGSSMSMFINNKRTMNNNINGAPEILGNLDGELPVSHYVEREFGGNGNIEIIYPLEFDIIQQEIIEVIGNANVSNFGYYTVTRFKAKYDNNYNLFHRSMPKEIINSSVPITDDVIAIWDTSSEDGEDHYWLILDVYDTGGGLIGSDEIVVYVEDNALIQDGWPLEITSYGTHSSFNAMDVDYDGDLELFLGNDYYGDDPNFYAWHHNGELLDNWPVGIPFWGGTYSSPAIGDLDGDGIMEIAVTCGQKLFVYHPDGSLVFSYYTDQGGCLFPSMGDVDNDGVLEIIYRGCDPVLYVFTSTGDHYDGYPLFLDEPPYPNGGGSQVQAVGDINGDGFLDVVFGTNYRRLYAYTLHNQEPVAGFPLDIPGRAYGPVLGDIDNDGDIEIIVAVEDYPICCDMYVWNADGTLYPGWPHDAYAVSGGENPQIASLGDIDGDGDLEIFFTSYWHKMFAWHHDGSNVNGWPKNNIGEWIFTQPIIGDIDGDGLPDIITQSRHNQTNSIIAFNNQGEIIDGFPKEIVSHSGRVYNSAPILDDLDKDGDIEIVSRSQDQWREGEFLLRVKVWDLQNEYNLSNMEWPMFQHDPHHTGFYTKKTSGPDVEITSISGGLFKVRATIKNTGSVEATGVNWSITLSGGLIPLGRETTGIIDSLSVGEKVTVSSNLILGIGKTIVTVTAEIPESSDMAKRNALVLLFFIKI